MQQIDIEDVLRADELAAQNDSRQVFPPGHTVHMSLDHSDRRQSISVATCDCGWEHREPWPGHHRAMDAAIETHWKEIENAMAISRAV